MDTPVENNDIETIVLLPFDEVAKGLAFNYRRIPRSNRVISRIGIPDSAEMVVLSGIDLFFLINAYCPMMQFAPMFTPGLI